MSDTPNQSNRRRWDEVTAIHAASEFYDLASFRAGKSSLRSVELEELDDVRGKSLLHLQCHFGLDTLSWARLGAKATGVDFSEAAITLAQALALELNLDARFFCCDVYDLPQHLHGLFDIVFTSYGVLAWLSDLHKWAAVVAHFLRPEGTFYMVEMHPLTDIFSDSANAHGPQVAYSYFPAPEPLALDNPTTYADRTKLVANSRSFQWTHTLGEIVSALAGAGLRIEFLHEFPYCVYAKFPFLQQGADGWWLLPDRNTNVPLMFSLKARKA
jgi:SAM-dependent methyltransferase